MKKTIKFFSVAASITLLAMSCKKSDNQIEVTKMPEVSSEIRSLVYDAGLNENWVTPKDGGYLIEDDIFLTKEELQEMSSSYGPNLNVANSEHYRTTNLVGRLPRTLSVSLSGGGTKFSNALNKCISRYNALNLRVKFRRVNSGGDMPVTTFYEGPSGGFITLGISNGFPRNGNPAPGFKLNTHPQALGNRAEESIAATMLHEMGHNIGFRHTDYANRNFSCGPNGGGNEGAGGVGAIYIPGTPSAANADRTSWMLACDQGTNRQFNANDRKALDVLY